MAEGVESTPSDALPLSLCLSPRAAVTPNCPHVSREVDDVSLFPKTHPRSFPRLRSRGILGYQISPSLPSFLPPRAYTPHHPLSSFLPRTSILSPYWSALHPSCTRLYITRLSPLLVPTLARHSVRKRTARHSRRLLTHAYLRRV